MKCSWELPTAGSSRQENHFDRSRKPDYDVGSDRPALCMGIMQPRHEMVVGRAQWRKQGKYGECKSTARVDFRQKCIRRTKKKKEKEKEKGAEKHHHYRRRKSRPAKGWSDWVHLIYLFPTRTHRPAMLY